MPSLDRVLLRGSSAEPLPVVWQTLASKGIKLRAGQLTLLAGVPNAGKSAVALILAHKMRLPTQYFSADTDRRTMFIRGAACVTGETQDDIEAALLDGHEDYYTSEVADGLGHIRFSFDSAPSLEDIAIEIRAFEETWGDHPRVVVVDNLLNLQGVGSGDHAAALEAVQYLHHLAHKTNASVLLLHHCSENREYDVCPPRSAILNKVNQLPELILTVAPQGDTIAVACVKSRNSPCDPSGNTASFLPTDIGRMQILDGK